MYIIHGLHTHQKLKRLAHRLVENKEKAIILTEHKSYVEDLFLEECQVLFDLEIMTLREFVNRIQVDHLIYDRVLMNKARLTYLIRHVLKTRTFSFFKYTSQPYALIGEIITTLRQVHQNHVTLMPDTDDQLTRQKCAELKIIDDAVNELKESNEYWTLEEMVSDLIDETLTTPLYIMGDDYATQGQKNLFGKIDHYVPVTILSPDEDGQQIAFWKKDFYQGESDDFLDALTPYEDQIIHHLFETTSVTPLQSGRLIIGGHPLQECEKVACDIKKRLIDDHCQLKDFLIITNQTSYESHLREIFDDWGLAHNIGENKPFTCDVSYRTIIKALPQLQDGTFRSITQELLHLSLEERYVSYLSELNHPDEISAAEFKLFMDATLSDQKANVPLGDILMIVPPHEAYHHQRKHVYLLGINEALLPEDMHEQGLLLDEDYQSLNPRPIDLTQRLGCHYVDLMEALLHPSYSFTFSYSQLDMSGQPIMPSILMNRLSQLFSLEEVTVDLNLLKKHLYLNGSRIPGEAVNAIGQQYLHSAHQPEKITADHVDALGRGISVSRIETYNKCPFQYYVKYGLKIEPPFQYELKSSELGSLCHHLMETCLDDPSLIEEEAKAYIDKELKKKYEESLLNRYIIHNVIANMKINIRIINRQLRQSGFSVLAKEQEISGMIASVPFYGIIDRLDAYGDYLRIIDYKSSEKHLDLNLAVQGFNIQMLIYLDMIAQKKEKKQAGAFYFNMRRRRFSSDNYPQTITDQELIRAYRMQGYLIDEGSYEIVKASEAIVPVTLKKDGTPDAHSKVISQKIMDQIITRIHNHVEELYQQVREGNIQIKPAILENSSGYDGVYPCTYCDYKDICLFDVFMNDNKIVARKVDLEEEDSYAPV